MGPVLGKVRAFGVNGRRAAGLLAESEQGPNGPRQGSRAHRRLLAVWEEPQLIAPQWPLCAEGAKVTKAQFQQPRCLQLGRAGAAE